MSVVLICLLAGCVAPGRIDEALISRYQRSLLRRSPQPRAGGEGLDLLRPDPGTSGPPLKIVRDPRTGVAQVRLSLDQAVYRALLNSMDIRVVGFDPAISREEMVQAAAAFDVIVFGGISDTVSDRRSSFAFAGSISRTTPVEVGLRKANVFGGQLEWRFSLTRTRDNSAFTMPNPQYESVTSLTLTQPLLRNAGRDFALAGLRIARLNHRLARSRFRQKVEEIVTRVETTYWALVQARREVEIQQRLLEETRRTYQRVRLRGRLDATRVEIEQTRAAVETRRAALYRAQKVAQDVQDQLARLLADAQINLLGRYEIIPTSQPVTNRLEVDSTDQLVTALRYSPLLEQARLAIATADVNVKVARNQTLPVLNLTASVGIQGLKRAWNKGLADMLSFDFIDRSLGVALEYPLGNRGPRSALRQRKFEKLRAVAEMQNTADQIALQVNESIRQIETTYREMKAQQAAVEASRLQLQALEDTERIRAQLTPEFLQVKLQAQENLAAAARAEIQAIVSFNNAIAALAQVTGTTLQRHRIRLCLEDATRYEPAPLSHTPLPRRPPAPTSAPATGPAAPATAPTTRPQ